MLESIEPIPVHFHHIRKKKNKSHQNHMNCIAFHHHMIMFADLDAKNMQSGRGPRSDSDLLKWDNEINTFDDDYEGKLLIPRHTPILLDPIK